MAVGATGSVVIARICPRIRPTDAFLTASGRCLRQCCGAPGDRCVADGRGRRDFCVHVLANRGAGDGRHVHGFSVYGSDGTLCFSVQAEAENQWLTLSTMALGKRLRPILLSR
jgi:hypothetical protein